MIEQNKKTKIISWLKFFTIFSLIFYIAPFVIDIYGDVRNLIWIVNIVLSLGSFISLFIIKILCKKSGVSKLLSSRRILVSIFFIKFFFIIFYIIAYVLFYHGILSEKSLSFEINGYNVLYINVLSLIVNWLAVILYFTGMFKILKTIKHIND
ncbi:MAG: hypothetical protein LBB39_03820 [Mycoplasmataceae bacterium]|jgi:hypothetical protein|nr:hypothetical protein [Mycoplasmataceae bacterium]